MHLTISKQLELPFLMEILWLQQALVLFMIKPKKTCMGMQPLFIGLNPNLHTKLQEPFKLTHS